MSIQFQLRRGTTAQINAITPAPGEILYDTSRHTIVVGDGTQTGGYPFPSLTSAGWVGIGISPATSPLHISNQVSDPSSAQSSAEVDTRITFTASNSQQIIGLISTMPSITSAGSFTYSGVITLMRSDSFLQSAAANGTFSDVRAAWFRAGISTSASTAIITNSYGVNIQMLNSQAGATITNCYGLYIASSSFTGTVTNLWDIYCADAAAKNYFAGQIYAGTGGASAPAYSFNADTNTGMFDVSADIIGWACGGTEMARLNGSGHFLIGTTVDNGHLTVGGNVMPEADNTRNLGSASFRWANSFVAQVVATKARITTSQTPATSGAAGTQGDFAWDASYFYICTATNTWHRVAHASW